MSQLAALADYYYDVAEVYEDPDIEPDDHLGVIRRALTSSHCDDLAWLLSAVTGWQVLFATWTIPNWGFGHHALVRAPDGRLLDITGWVDEGDLKARYTPHHQLIFKDCVGSNTQVNPVDDTEAARLLLLALPEVPYAPFNLPWFQERLQAAAAKADALGVGGSWPPLPLPASTSGK